jgi:hypothetical protein
MVLSYSKPSLSQIHIIPKEQAERCHNTLFQYTGLHHVDSLVEFCFDYESNLATCPIIIPRLIPVRADYVSQNEGIKFPLYRIETLVVSGVVPSLLVLLTLYFTLE